MPLDFLFHIPSNHGNRIAEPGYVDEHPLGGSETSVLHLAEALRQLGHQARVETDPAALAGAEADVFISCREWRTLLNCPVTAHLRYYWAHDDSNQPFVLPLEDPALAARLYAACHGVAVVSRYQGDRWRETLHLPAAKAFLGLNGLPRAAIADTLGPLPRAPRAYYASHPGRGLAMLLGAWPSIRGAVPDAELHLYGSAAIYNQKNSPEEAALFTQAAALPGVSVLGAVGKKQLREGARTCRLLAYPSTFAETSCLTALEAMAAGCAVVAPMYGALPETAWRNPLVWPSDDWLALWTWEVCRILADDHYYLEIARRNLTLARLLDTREIAQSWLRRIALDAAIA